MFNNFTISTTATSTDGTGIINSSLSNPLILAGNRCRKWTMQGVLGDNINTAYAAITVNSSVGEGAFIGTSINKKITVKAWIRHGSPSPEADCLIRGICIKPKVDWTSVEYKYERPGYFFGIVKEAAYNVGGNFWAQYNRFRLSGISNNSLDRFPSGVPQSDTDGNGQAIVSDKWYRLKLEVYNISPLVDRLTGYHFTGTDENNPTHWTQILTLDTDSNSYKPWSLNSDHSAAGAFVHISGWNTGQPVPADNYDFYIDGFSAKISSNT